MLSVVSPVTFHIFPQCKEAIADLQDSTVNVKQNNIRANVDFLK